MEEYIHYISNLTKSNDYSEVSLFWKKQYVDFKINKSKFDFLPSEEEIKNLRSWGKRKAMGNGNPNDQKGWAKRSYSRLLKAFPKEKILEYSINLKESNFGNPIRLKTDIGNFSGMFYLNIINTYCICNAIKEHYLDKSLDICEIGTGWGQYCEILNQKLPISSYTSIDLKETLVLSYLNAVHNFDFSDIQLISDKESKKYNYCIPENIEHLENNDKLYDIFLNSCSFQEMSKKNVISYVNFIKKKLKKGGLFISINSWGYGRFEIKKFSDLQLHNFEIIDIFKDPRSVGLKQLVVICKNTDQNKQIDINKLDKLALELRDNKIKKEEFLNNIYNGKN